MGGFLIVLELMLFIEQAICKCARSTAPVQRPCLAKHCRSTIYSCEWSLHGCATVQTKSVVKCGAGFPLAELTLSFLRFTLNSCRSLLRAAS